MTPRNGPVLFSGLPPIRITGRQGEITIPNRLLVLKVVRALGRKADALLGHLHPLDRTLHAIALRPYELHLELTNLCNANCVFCPYQGPRNAVYVRRSFPQGDRGLHEHRRLSGADAHRWQCSNRTEIPEACSLYPLLPADLTAGTRSLRKGVHYLLKAWRRLAPAGDVELWLVGKMSLAPRLLEKLPGRVVVRPSVPHQELFEIYRRASVLVFPSLCEGFGMVITEAMANGLPVITTSSTAGPDLIESGKNGFIVPIRDSEKLAETISGPLTTGTRCGRWVVRQRKPLLVGNGVTIAQH